MQVQMKTKVYVKVIPNCKKKICKSNLSAQRRITRVKVGNIFKVMLKKSKYYQNYSNPWIGKQKYIEIIDFLKRMLLV